MSLLTIKNAAAQAGLAPGTLRDYEKAGLLSPQRDSSGRRLYSDTDVRKARKVAADRRARVGKHLRGAEVTP
jgi:MerR family transcriptional regulator, copper efflux regulator